MRAIVLNGGEKGDGAVAALHGMVVEELEAAGWEAEPVRLCELSIGYCAGCFGCWVKTPGICVVDDDRRRISRDLIRSDLAVYLTRVTFGGYSSLLKRAVDGILCLGHPYFQKRAGEIHHRKRYGRYPSLLGIGVLQHSDGEAEDIFSTLVARNAINLHSPSHGSCVLSAGEPPEASRQTMRQHIARMRPS